MKFTLIFNQNKISYKMKLNFRSLLIATLALGMLSTQFSFAQKRLCGTDELTRNLIAAHPEYQQQTIEFRRRIQNYVNTHSNDLRSTITIPVVVHVVSGTALADANISDAQIQSQIDVLNRDFSKTNTDAIHIPSVFSPLASNTEIRFCLAQRKPDPAGTSTNGIERRINTSVTTFPASDESFFTTVKRYNNGGLDPWDRTRYLNIWVCNLPGSVAGFGTIPPILPNLSWQDGVVISSRVFSSYATSPIGYLDPAYSMGRSCVHEVGHYLGLCHIWGCADFCQTDNCSDTPIQDHSNFGSPTFPTYNTNIVTCGTSPNGNMFMNYMDYPDDKAALMFTANQSAIMNGVLNTDRLLLKNSDRDDPPASALSTPIIATGLYADMITQTEAQIHWLKSAAATYTVKYKNLTTQQTSFTNVNTTNNYITLTGLSPFSQYEVQIQSNFSGTSATSSSITFYTDQYYPCSPIGDVPNLRNSAHLIFNPPFPSHNRANRAETIGIQGDEDWYKFTATNFRLSLSRMSKDYDMRVYKGNSTTPLDIAPLNPFTDRETIRSYNNTISDTYYIQIKGYRPADHDAANCYMLSVYWANSDKNDEEYTTDIEQEIIIYPNPTNSNINIEFHSNINTFGQVEMLNLSGQVLKSEKLAILSGDNFFNLNVGNIAPGLYIVKTMFNDTIRYNKIIIE